MICVMKIGWNNPLVEMVGKGRIDTFDIAPKRRKRKVKE